MRRTHSQAIFRLVLVGAVVQAATGCSILNLKRTAFPSAAIMDDGRGLYLDDINTIINDSSLSTDEKRQALEDLGIEDDALIDALLS
ncbi:MAG: hypothetical protein JXB13_06830 [Phycisphaerae bacterium]|nr:hypothetical protein [Phycisphaerae bacterium]